MFCVFFFKQKTAYEMRIRDWSSDVCSSESLRYTWDDTDGTASIRQVAAGLIPLVDAAHASETKTSALTYTAGLDYKFDTTLLYGKISRGYKTGGISEIGRAHV